MMDRKENFMRFINHEPHDHVPCTFDVCMAGGGREFFENGFEDDIDGFGLKWVKTETGMGAGTPVANQTLIPDITEWRKYVKFPDIAGYDWQAQADEQLANYDPATQVLNYGCWNGQFLRFTHLLGFEDALCQMLMEPEASEELIDAITDYRIETLPYIKKYFNPDTITIYDDVAASTRMFISPDTYEELFVPAHKRFFDAARDLGMIPSIHICGKCEDIIPYLPEEGAEVWEIAEPSNDLVRLSQELGDKLAIFGGWSMTNEFAVKFPGEEVLRAAVRDTIDKYAPAGNYGYFGFLMYTDPELMGAATVILNSEAMAYGTNYYVDGPGAGTF